MRPVSGEVVFNTGMAGYIESLTDPSYRGQILVCTYPLIGNYGAPGPRFNEELSDRFESSRIHVQGLVVQNYVDQYSHHSASWSLREWLDHERVPGLTGIDTRTLTRKLREVGTMQGWLVPDGIKTIHAVESAEREDMNEGVFYSVTLPEPIFYQGGDRTVLLVDIGAKDNIVRCLLARGVSVLRVPWHARLRDHLKQTDGVIIGNGPGDPERLDSLTSQLREILDDYNRPVFGICLGNQLLARAAGAETFKLPYGHRGVNQPVRDVLNGRCFITSQNHGYAVAEETLPKDWQPWFANINDGTNEGIRSRSRPFCGVQFHPEACPGPEDTRFLFDDFLKQVGEAAS
jgi:carbamoyl-phosphate synthase small subunit